MWEKKIKRVKEYIAFNKAPHVKSCHNDRQNAVLITKSVSFLRNQRAPSKQYAIECTSFAQKPSLNFLAQTPCTKKLETYISIANRV